jgi:hypothetical protein
MASFFGYLLLSAGIITFLVSLFDDSSRSSLLKLVAIVVPAIGLAILNYAGVAIPPP